MEYTQDTNDIGNPDNIKTNQDTNLMDKVRLVICILALMLFTGLNIHYYDVYTLSQANSQEAEQKQIQLMEKKRKLGFNEGFKTGKTEGLALAKEMIKKLEERNQKEREAAENNTDGAPNLQGIMNILGGSGLLNGILQNNNGGTQQIPLESILKSLKQNKEE